MNIRELFKKSADLAQLNKQAALKAPPLSDVPFIAMMFSANLNVIRVFNEATGATDYVVVSEDVINAVKFGVIQQKSCYVSKTETGIIAVHLHPKQTNNSWLKSFFEALEAACVSPVFIGRDHDAKIYNYQRVSDAVISPITDEESDEAVSATFDDYIIDRIDHPALEGLLKKDEEPSPIQSATLQSTVIPTKEVKNEFVLDMSELDLDVSESEFNLLDDAE